MKGKVATLFCAESLRAVACVTMDALAARGWSVRLHTGEGARAALRCARDPHAGLRVLVLPEPVDTRTHEALRKALDIRGRGDVLIADFTTPRALLDVIERSRSFTRRTRHRSHPRTYLRHPTSVEAPVPLRYWSRFGLASAAAALIVIMGLLHGTPQPRRAGTASPASVSAPTLNPEPVLASQRPARTLRGE